MTRYEKGFIEKCAEYGVDGAAVLSHMQKRAGLVGAGTRLAVKLHPKVNPDKLNWFTKLFTNTKKIPTTIRSSAPVTEALANMGSGGGGFSAAMQAADTSSKGMREVTRLSPGKILAALGLTGGAGALGGAAAGSKGAAPSAAAAQGNSKAILAALLGVGAAGAGTAAAMSGKDNDDKSKDTDKGKEKKKPVKK